MARWRIILGLPATLVLGVVLVGACRFVPGCNRSNGSAVGLGRNYQNGGVFRGVTPRFSADGQMIVYAGLAGRSSQIFACDVRTRARRRITHTTSWELSPAFLRSGKYIAFASDRDNANGEYYVMASDGNAVRRIALGCAYRDDGSAFSQCPPQPSPAGDGVAFSARDATGHSGVFVWDNTQGTLRRISPAGCDAGGPIWSATGAFLYFSQARDADPRTPYDIVRAPMNGGPCETLFAGKVAVLGTTLDEKNVIVVQVRCMSPAVFVASAADHWQLHLLASSAGEAAWSAHAAAAIVVNGSPGNQYDYNLWRVGLNGPIQQITAQNGYIQEPAFSWDGRGIVFDGDESGAPERGFASIISAQADGTGIRTLCDTKN